MVALGWTVEKAPSFWEGATENHESRNYWRSWIELSKQVIWVTDGGGGDTARNSFSDVRCTRIATSNATCPNATGGHTTSSRPLGAEQLQGRCCRSSSAGLRHQRVGGGFTPRSARGVLTLHRLKVPALAQEAFDVESMFSMVRSCEATSNAIGTAKCASAGSPRCYCMRPVPTSQGLDDTVVAAIDAIQREDARGRVSSGRKSGT